MLCILLGTRLGAISPQYRSPRNGLRMSEVSSLTFTKDKHNGGTNCGYQKLDEDYYFIIMVYVYT